MKQAFAVVVLTCFSRATGTARVDGARMTMTGTYNGSNSCTGSFTNGQMMMTRR